MVKGQLTSFSGHLGSVPLEALTRVDDEEAGCLTKTSRHWHAARLARAKMVFEGLLIHLLMYLHQTKCVDLLMSFQGLKQVLIDLFF